MKVSRAKATPEEIERIVNRALDLRVNIIDTAYAYGQGEAQKAGKVKFIGISTHASPEDMKKMINCGEFDVITVSYNLINYQRQAIDGEDISITEREILPLAKKRKLGVTIMKPFGGGILAKNPLSEVKISPIQALKFVISNPYVDTATPGVGSIAELEEDVKAGDPHILLSREDIARLREDAEKWGPDFCRNCGYCLPCSEDIPIPQIMRLLMRYGLGEEGKKNRAKKAYINLEIKASACTECKKCEERCPYHLSISKKMKEAQEVFE